jgi:oxygen-independent coproporphyrinogen-3 oxidase
VTPRAAKAGLYLHFPFCARVCPYCDFAVRPGSAARRASFVTTLLAEIELHRGTDLEFDTVYLGGGTPSELAPDDLARLLGAVSSTLPVTSDVHVYLEANPEDVTPGLARSWRALGVATVSLGVQSLETRALAFLGRRHTADQARAAFADARAAGFATVSLDLIYGLPFDDPNRWRRDLEAAVTLGPDHISCYQLAMPEGTLFGKLKRRGEMVPIGEAAEADLFLLTHETLAAAGYDGYEVSNFARSPRHRSRHNQKYWSHVPYLGLGPSAHSFAAGRRWWNERRLEDWQARVLRGERPEAGGEDLTPADLALETVMLGLRTREGVDLDDFSIRHRIDLARRNRPLLARLAAEGLIVLDDHSIRPTRRGLAVADSLARSLSLADSSPPAPSAGGDGARRRSTAEGGLTPPVPALTIQ